MLMQRRMFSWRFVPNELMLFLLISILLIKRKYFSSSRSISAYRARRASQWLHFIWIDGKRRSAYTFYSCKHSFYWLPRRFLMHKDKYKYLHWECFTRTNTPSIGEQLGCDCFHFIADFSDFHSLLWPRLRHPSIIHLFINYKTICVMLMIVCILHHKNKMVVAYLRFSICIVQWRDTRQANVV